MITYKKLHNVKLSLSEFFIFDKKLIADCSVYKDNNEIQKLLRKKTKTNNKFSFKCNLNFIRGLLMYINWCTNDYDFTKYTDHTEMKKCEIEWNDFIHFWINNKRITKLTIEKSSSSSNTIKNRICNDIIFEGNEFFNDEIIENEIHPHFKEEIYLIGIGTDKYNWGGTLISKEIYKYILFMHDYHAYFYAEYIANHNKTIKSNKNINEKLNKNINIFKSDINKRNLAYWQQFFGVYHACYPNGKIYLPDKNYNEFKLVLPPSELAIKLLKDKVIKLFNRRKIIIIIYILSKYINSKTLLFKILHHV